MRGRQTCENMDRRSQWDLDGNSFWRIVGFTQKKHFEDHLLIISLFSSSQGKDTEKPAGLLKGKTTALCHSSLCYTLTVL